MAEDLPCTAVILFKPDHAAVSELLFKGEDVFDRCAAKFIDALIVIPDDTDIAPTAGNERGKEKLQMVGILILVYENILKPTLPVTPDLLVLAQKLDGVEKQIVKIHRARRKQAAHILNIDLPYTDPAEISALFGAPEILACIDPGVFGAADLGKDGFIRETLLVQIQISDDLLGKTLTVGSIVDRKAARKAELLRIASKHADAGGMEGTRPDVLRLFAQHTPKALLEFPCRLIGKGDGKNTPWRHGIERGRFFCLLAAAQECLEHLLIRTGRQPLAVGGTAVPKQVRDPVDQHRRLSASRSGQDQQRAFCGKHRLALHVIELCKVSAHEISASFDKSLCKVVHVSDFTTQTFRKQA